MADARYTRDKRKPFSLALTDSERAQVIAAAKIKDDYPSAWARETILASAKRILTRVEK